MRVCAFTSSSRMKGCVLVLADTLKRLSISRIRMKSHTGFLFAGLLNVSSASLSAQGSTTPWKKGNKLANQWIRPSMWEPFGLHKSRITHKPLKHPEDTQLQRVHEGTLVMPTVDLWVAGYGVDKGTASHLLGAATPMMHQCLKCPLLEHAVKTLK